uniref:Uncharacterized protein n=1 Tax=Triticum urartu TaxID=4572 RepID=A0A8R7TDK8_TRIUA
PNLEHKLKLLELELPGDPSYFPDRLVVRGRRSRFLGLRRRRRLLVVGSCGVSSCSSSAVRPDCTFEMARFRLLTAIEELC